jgi:geranylgeranyl diphosphate synthase type II
VDFSNFYPDYTQWFRGKFSERISRSRPAYLYEPIAYVLRYSGKQLRPAILAASAQAFGNRDREYSFPAAACVEMIHNFTLIHDDIMDADLLRHGMKTVHAKWDVNHAILSGDALFALAIAEMNAYRGEADLYVRLLPLILDAVIRVCEGQALDMEFETRDEVNCDAYLEMVTDKTAYLLAVSGKLGVLIGGGGPEAAERVEELLLKTGVLFQIQDDLLELTSSNAQMGKSLGSDLVKRKKTYPSLFAKQALPAEVWQEFLERSSEAVIRAHGTGPARELLESYFIFDKIQDVIKLYYEDVMKLICSLPGETQELYRTMLAFILHRKK